MFDKYTLYVNTEHIQYVHILFYFIFRHHCHPVSNLNKNVLLLSVVPLFSHSYLCKTIMNVYTVYLKLKELGYVYDIRLITHYNKCLQKPQLKIIFQV